MRVQNSFITILLLVLTIGTSISSVVAFDCSSVQDCATCLATPGCGFCAGTATGSCVSGNTTGPFNPTDCPAPAWTPTANQCAHRPCFTPTLPADTSYGTCLTSTGWSTDGTTCSLTCIDGFTASGDPNLICQDGTWNGTQSCTDFDPNAILPVSGFKMSSVDWFLVVFISVWTFLVLLSTVLLISGKILPHLGESPTRLILWDLDAELSTVQKQQRCRRWIVALLGNCVISLAIAALATDTYSQATLPTDAFDASVEFRVFGYETKLGPPQNYDSSSSYPSCSSSEPGDSTLCYLFRISFYATFFFGLFGVIASVISLVLIFLVLLRYRRENAWKAAMKFNLSGTLAFLSAVLIYGSTTHVVLKQMFDTQLNFEFDASWFILLGTTFMSGFYSCMTYLYYRPTNLDDEEDDVDRAAPQIKQPRSGSSASASARGGNEYGAMRDSPMA